MQFVSETKFYDTVLSYDNAEENLKRSKSVIVDFAGNSDYLKKLSDHLGEELKHVSLIGLADWSSKTNFKYQERQGEEVIYENWFRKCHCLCNWYYA